MQISGNFSVAGADAAKIALKSNAPAPSDPATGASISTPVDRLELSSEALGVSNTQQSSEIFRADKVASLREAIAQGDYDTDEKLSVAFDRLLDQLG